MANNMQFNARLCAFLDASPTPFHAVETMVARLTAAGFTPLLESDDWSALTQGQYFVTRNDGSLIAFTLPNKADLAESGFRMLGAHTDSPCLKVKPNADIFQQGFLQLGVEVYGGALLNPWFDRDLSLAGRVSYADNGGQVHHVMVNFERAVATIPSLAIHLDNDANNNRTINPQQHLPAIVMQCDSESQSFKNLLETQLLAQYPNSQCETILDYEICLYDTQPAAITGINSDFISSARLDNLLSCFVGLEALLACNEDKANLLVCNDHEEVGSMTSSGAQGPFLSSVLMRLAGSNERYYRMIEQSMMISIDNAHAVHPNYADKHDKQHGPELNAGPVIKSNANQRYATNSETASFFRQLCHANDIPVQDFVMRNDMRCGSTIGPITASELGVKTLDIGLPSLGMHSIREHAGSQDAFMLTKVLTQFYR